MKIFLERQNLHQEKVSCGTIEMIPGESYFDISIKDGKSEEILGMQFRFDLKPSSAIDLRSIIQNFYTNTTASVGFIVSLNFTNALADQETCKDLPGNFSIFSMAPLKNEMHTLAFKRHFPVITENDKNMQFDMKDDFKLSVKSQVTTDFSKKSYHFDKSCNTEKELNIPKKKRDTDRPFCLIFISLADLNEIEDTEKFIRTHPIIPKEI
jgi:hypothetical protein